MSEASQPTPNNSQQTKIIKRTMTMSASFEGPIPPPEILEGYEKILPGLADRIMTMAETQLTHRHGLERGVILFDKIKSMIGLCFAFLIVVGGFGAAVYLALHGQAVTAGIFTVGPLATIAGIFIYQKQEAKPSDGPKPVVRKEEQGKSA
jgi:uncharacterized membrane protein